MTSEIKSVFSVFKRDTAANGDSVIFGQSGSSGDLFWQSISTNFYYVIQYLYNPVYVNYLGVAADLNTHQATTILDTASLRSWYDGVYHSSKASLPLGGGGNISISTSGSNNGMDGDISEVIGYDTGLSEYEKQRVETYLSQKYKVTNAKTSPVLDTAGLKLWLKADAGVSTVTENAAQFTAASTQYLSAASNSSLQSGDIDFTIAAWVKFSSLPGATNQVIMAKYGSAANQVEYMLRYTPSNFAFTPSTNGTSASTYNVLSPITPVVGKWYFVVAWHDATANTVNIQVDSSAAYSASDNGGIFAGSAAFTIGASADALMPIDGFVAKAGYWKRVLSASERAALYNSGKGLNYKGLDSNLKTSLQSYWNLDEASGNRADSFGTNTLTSNNSVAQSTGPSSSNMSSWSDQSGNSLSAIQSTTAKRPVWIADGGSSINSKPVVRFSGGQSLLTSTINSSIGTIFMVGKYTQDQSITNWFSVAGNNSWYYSATSNSVTNYFMWYLSGWRNSSNAGDLSPHISVHTLSSTNSNIYVDGVNRASNSGTYTTTGGDFLLGCLADMVSGGCSNGSERYLSGDIAEIGVYSGVLTTAQRQAVECYLSSKYNIALSGVTCP